MQSAGREPSMEDILASIKKVIAEEKELRTTVRRPRSGEDEPMPEDIRADEDFSSSTNLLRRALTLVRR